VLSQLRRHAQALASLEPRKDARVVRWHIAGRATLFALLAFSTLQYYFFDVALTIMALPGVRVFPFS